MEVTPLFAMPFAVDQMADHAALCEELARLFLEKEAEGDRWRTDVRRETQKGALFESRFDLFQWSDPPVRRVAAFCHAAVARLVASLSDYEPAELERLTFDYHAWFHVTRAGGYQGLHHHQNASWSGIFCVDPGDVLADRPDSGLVRFHDPRWCSAHYMDAGNRRLKAPFHHGGFDVAHKAGQLVVFPSYVMHEIFPYLGQRPRIVVAFNAWVRMTS
jgi:uncharacterized protein (TIGR02466 family)